MAHEIGIFPQGADLPERRSVIDSRGLSIREVMKLEWRNEADAHPKEGTEGAVRFAAGSGTSETLGIFNYE